MAKAAAIILSTKGPHNTHASWVGQNLGQPHWVCTDPGDHSRGKKQFWFSLLSMGRG